jgi:hypothetical protein
MADSIKELFSELSGKGTDLIQGTVMSLNPFKIQAVNDSKLIISKISLVIPSRLGSLEAGDRVHMLVLNKGKKYYVLDRV